MPPWQFPWKLRERLKVRIVRALELFDVHDETSPGGMNNV